MTQDAASTMDRSLPIQEVARILAVNATTVRDLISRGMLAAHRVGTGNRNIRVRESAVEAYRTASIIPARPASAPAAVRRRPNPRQAAAMDMLKELDV